MTNITHWHCSSCQHQNADPAVCRHYCPVLNPLKPVHGKRLSENAIGIILLLLSCALILFVWFVAKDNMAIVIPAMAITIGLALLVARMGGGE